MTVDGPSTVRNLIPEGHQSPRRIDSDSPVAKAHFSVASFEGSLESLVCFTLNEEFSSNPSRPSLIREVSKTGAGLETGAGDGTSRNEGGWKAKGNKGACDLFATGLWICKCAVTRACINIYENLCRATRVPGKS